MGFTTMTLPKRGELLPYKCPLGVDCFYLWKYVPSVAAAVIFLILYLAASLMHTWRMARLRMWFCIPFVIGGFRMSQLSSIAPCSTRQSLTLFSRSHRLRWPH